MKNFFLVSAIILPLGIFAQVNNVNPQAQNINYYNQIDENNNSLGNSSGKINDDKNSIQTNIINQQANPPMQIQQQKS